MVYVYKFTFHFCLKHFVLCFFCVSLEHSLPVLLFCYVWFSFYNTKPRDWLGRTSLKWRILSSRKYILNSVKEPFTLYLYWRLVVGSTDGTYGTLQY